MEISSFSTPSPSQPSKPAPSGLRGGGLTTVAASATADRSANLGAFQSIQQAMNNLPDTRADAVARGKALVASPIYPAAEIINKLAAMFIEDAASALAANS